MTAIMIQGTTSDAGKSAFVTGLCRLLKRRGISVAPFKPQNMALNSAVTVDGGEIGRAQALQADACGLEPHTDMNPVLLKPNTDIGCQVIINGRAVGNMDAQSYHQYKQTAKEAVLAAYHRLKQQYQVIVVEGAGSPAEINLRGNDIANMGFAEAVDCPVLLIADIDRGGVFAHIVGTLALLSESEQARTKGFIINRFRGDIALLENGLEWLEEHAHKRVVGVLPYLHDLHLEAEDAINSGNQLNDNSQTIKVVVPVLPRISNHTDFDALRLNPQVELVFVPLNEKPPAADLIILPGSKSVAGDLQALNESDWDHHIKKHLRYGGKLMGICGGYQMLGNRINDPYHIESERDVIDGLGLLDFETVLQQQKKLTRVEGKMVMGGVPVTGYEIHAGVSCGPALSAPFATIDNHPEGVISPDDQIIGTYLHGVFDHPQAAEQLLKWAGLEQGDGFDYGELRERGINQMADVIEKECDMAFIMELIGMEETNLKACS